MDSSRVFSLKIYLIKPNSEPEVRRFGLQSSDVMCYNKLRGKLSEIFPGLSDKAFRIYWKDEEGEEIAVSSDEELMIAMTCMVEDLKKFYVKLGSAAKNPGENRGKILHPNVFCDGCESNITGFRYKCILCNDYDLCELCEKFGIHAEHPLLRIPEPRMIKRSNLKKINNIMESFFVRDKQHERKHFYDGDCLDENFMESYKKKKKCERRESGLDTGDESEDGGHRKHSHKKWKKGRCGYRTLMEGGRGGRRRRRESINCLSSAGPYTHMMSDFFNYLAPIQGQAKLLHGPNVELKNDQTRESNSVNYLKSLISSLQKFMTPLGVDVEFEVRPKCSMTEQKMEESEKKTPPPTPSAPEKEVRFSSADLKSDTMTRQKVDEIAKLLAKQTMDGSKNSDDGWVSFEELKKDCEEPRPSVSTGAIPKVPQTQEKVVQENNKSKTTMPQENQNLYPNLNCEQISKETLIKTALEKMLSMGFVNEGDSLRLLLEAKNGDITKVLEEMIPYCNN